MYQVTYYCLHATITTIFDNLDKAMEYIHIQLENGVYIECRYVENKNNE